MSFFVEDSGGSFENCPSGMHLARNYRIIDVGTQKSTYMGQVKYLHKVMLAWEILSVGEDGTPLRMRDGRPFTIFKNYTLSWSEKANLRLDLQSWRGKPFTQEELRRFDLKNVLGAWCMLNVIEKPSQDGSKVYANINGITPVPAMIRQAGLPAAVNPNQIFNLSDPDLEMFQTFSESLKRKIESSPEWEKISKPNRTLVPVGGDPSLRAAEQAMDEEIPF